MLFRPYSHTLRCHYVIRCVRGPDTRVGSTRVSDTAVSRVGQIRRRVVQLWLNVREARPTINSSCQGPAELDNHCTLTTLDIHSQHPRCISNVQDERHQLPRSACSAPSSRMCGLVTFLVWRPRSTVICNKHTALYPDS